MKRESVICKTVEDMTDKTLELLMDDHKRRSFQKGIEYASQFTWEDTVKKTMNVYNELCGKH